MRAWSTGQAQERPGLVALGYFGSYARGDWGVGSDLDVIAIVDDSPAPFESRAVDWELNSLPVPAEILVYTQREWDTLQKEANQFILGLNKETVWTYRRKASGKGVKGDAP